MKNHNPADILITGLGVTSAVGQGKADFISALLQGRDAFGVMRRSGRQRPAHSMGDKAEPDTAFLGAEISSLAIPGVFPQRVLRTTSFSGKVALATLYEAWHEAGLDEIDPERIGLVIGGSNFQQRELLNSYETYRQRPAFLRPTYGMSFLDSDLCGLCTESFGIRGFAYTLGGASASGQLAVVQAAQAVQAGLVDACIAMGALMDLSYWECQGLRSLGAMGSDRYAQQPELACRPFDQHRDGFIYGEACGAVVIESTRAVQRTGITPYARLAGWAVGTDANRNPNPSVEGEVRVMEKALRQAQLSPNDIDYINPHGTGSVIGDEIELQAIRQSKMADAYINTTKSIIGHGLSAAGAVELVATALQMREGALHASRNLQKPLSDSYNWVRHQAVSHSIKHALNLSMGFGGINSAVCLQAY